MPCRRIWRESANRVTATATIIAPDIQSMDVIVPTNLGTLAWGQSRLPCHPVCCSFHPRKLTAAKMSTRFIQGSSRGSLSANRREVASGINVSATIIETPIARQIVSPASRIQVETRPVARKKNGMKTHMVVKPEAKTAIPTSLLPDSVAVRASSPSS